MEPVNPLVQDFVHLLDIFFQANPFAGLIQMILAHARPELRIVQEQVCQFRALLDEVERGHSLDLALKLFQGNPHQLAQHVTGIVESQRLVEIAGKQKMLQRFLGHVLI